MRVIFHKDFEKTFRHLTPSQKKKFGERLSIFLEEPFAEVLENHPPKGRYKGYKSISIGGDLRALYKEVSRETAIFTHIGTHHQLAKIRNS
jgi:mRNA-degrading endonuclease YafQ of YafQ-DinJ toxin-antitoxin module